jgi:UDP-4-amino-4-deoxy-L-arabinose-oxoglutarate aminotransferase
MGRRYALGVTSCTGALHMSLLALGVGPGDEVITTPMSFLATATAIIEAGAKPVFVDVESDTGNLDAGRVEGAITPRTKAILPVHLYGLMCDMKALREIADRRGLALIEDAAHCIEGTRNGVRPGQLGSTACFSFYATKTLTCGEGGAVVTDSEELYERMRMLRHHGMTKTAADRMRDGYQHWDMAEFGWKYNMSNIEAALLLPQFQRLQDNHRLRGRLARLYAEHLSGIGGVLLPSSRDDATHSWHLYTIRVPADRRDQVIKGFTRDGIGCAVNYRPIHLTTYFRNAFGFKERDFPNAERIGSETISLPFYPKMPPAHIPAVAESLRRTLERGR